MRETVRFLLGNEPREIRAVDPTMTVLDYLRLVERRCGTKEGCAEGDCGACTVVLGRLMDGRLRYGRSTPASSSCRPSTACQLLTVEDLKRPDGVLHPVQQAMVETHGSQCGFCTPGFVMSLFALSNAPRPTTATPSDAERVDDALAGNLCRCTGYRPIVDAAQRMYRAEPRRAAASRRSAPTRWPGSRRCRTSETVSVGADGRRFFAPAYARRVGRLCCSNIRRRPSSPVRPMSGLWVTKFLRVLDPVIWVGRVRELRRDRGDGRSELRIGAGVTYSRRDGQAGGALSRPRRADPPARRRAGAQRGHHRRQYRQRLADRRQSAGADRARRARSSSAAGGSGASCRSRTSSSTTASRTGGRPSSSRRSSCPSPSRACASAPTRSPSASTRTSRR